MELDALFSAVKQKYKNLQVSTLKKEQKMILSNSLNGLNSIGILPTGYGKSLTYILPPLLFDQIHPDVDCHVALVVSPLRSLMFDQVYACRNMGINAVAIVKSSEMTKNDIESVQKGSASIVFISPENLQFWLPAFKRYKKNICLVALDEVHCVSEWGGDFRPEFRRVVELRSIFSKSTFTCLSATVTNKILEDITELMQFKQSDTKVISVLPNRENIFLEVVHKKKYDFENDLQWIIDGLRLHGTSYPKTILFAQTIKQVADMYEFIISELRDEAYNGEIKDYESRIVSMYHSNITPDLQRFSLESFRKPETNIRLLISTIAFGMGVEVVDIKQVIHWGKSKSLLGHWQEVGRAGRDGHEAKAIWYPQSVAGEDTDTFKEIKMNKDVCIRKIILEHFLLPESDISVLKEIENRFPCTSQCDNCLCASCTCCSHCLLKCPCPNVNKDFLS